MAIPSTYSPELIAKMQAYAEKSFAAEFEGAEKISTEASFITWLGKFHRVEYKIPQSSLLPATLTLFETEKDAASKAVYSEVGMGIKDELNIRLYSERYSLSSHVHRFVGLTFGNIALIETTTKVAREVLSVQLLTPQILERIVPKMGPEGSS